MHHFGLIRKILNPRPLAKKPRQLIANSYSLGDPDYEKYHKEAQNPVLFASRLPLSGGHPSGSISASHLGFGAAEKVDHSKPQTLNSYNPES